MPKHPIIAIDGPAAAGKGTLARRLAQEFSLAYLDTGILYRGVAWLMLDGGHDPHNASLAQDVARNFSLDDIRSADIRTGPVGKAASIIAVNEGVRAALLAFQREFAISPPALVNGELVRGVVLDGRDIGTVVCPDANLKIYVTASARERAHRRWLELVQSNQALTKAQVLADVEARDARDSGRETSPLTMAQDAHLIDTTHLSIDAAFAAARALMDPLLKG